LSNVTRARLPGRHDARTIPVRYADLSGLSLKAYITYGTDARSADEGRVTEVFIVAGKPGSSAEAAMRDVGILLSLALQHGLTLDQIARSLTRGEDNEPAGPLGIVVDALIADLASTRGEQA
jgi:ribonucleoside-diphosphate reductase alpha chain